MGSGPNWVPALMGGETLPPKSPLAAAVLTGRPWDSPQEAHRATMWAQPAAGSLEIALRLSRMSANLRPVVGLREPEKLPVIPGVM